MYKLDFKIKVVKEVKKTSINKVCEKYSLNYRMVKNWYEKAYSSKRSIQHNLAKYYRAQKEKAVRSKRLTLKDYQKYVQELQPFQEIVIISFRLDFSLKNKEYHYLLLAYDLATGRQFLAFAQKRNVFNNIIFRDYIFSILKKSKGQQTTFYINTSSLANYREYEVKKFENFRFKWIVKKIITSKFQDFKNYFSDNSKDIISEEKLLTYTYLYLLYSNKSKKALPVITDKFLTRVAKNINSTGFATLSKEKAAEIKQSVESHLVKENKSYAKDYNLEKLLENNKLKLTLGSAPKKTIAYQAFLLKKLGLFEESEEYFKYWLLHYKETDWQKVDLLLDYGILLFDRSDYAGALKKFKKGTCLSKKINYKRGYLSSLYFQSSIYLQLNKPEKSKKYLKALSENYSSTLPYDLKAKYYTCKANYYFNIKKYNESFQEYQIFFRIAKNNQNLEDQATCLENMGVTSRLLNKFQKALRYFQKSLIIKEKLGYKLNTVTSLINLANLYAKMNKYEKSAEYGDKALYVLQGSENYTQLLQITNLQSLIYFKQEKYKKALELWVMSYSNLKLSGLDFWPILQKRVQNITLELKKKSLSKYFSGRFPSKTPYKKVAQIKPESFSEK